MTGSTRGARRTRAAALAAAALASASAATAIAATVPPKELSWSIGKRTHFLRVGPPVGAEPLPGLELPGRGSRGKGAKGEPPTSERRLLLSVVGPIVSRYERTAGGRGVDGWVTEHIQTEWLDGYTFDLRSYLARNARLPAGLEDAHFDRFAVVDWDGRDALTLAVERKGCEMGGSTCSLQTVTVVAPPPSGWRPWLEASMRGEGFVLHRAAGWWSTLTPDALARARSALEEQPTPRARREWIAREVHGRMHAPITAAWLAAETFPLDRFADVETQWAVADRLRYLASADELLGPEVPSCAGPSLEALSRRGWSTAPARTALSNVVLCLRVGRAGAPEVAALERVRLRCAGADAPLACARPELAPMLDERNHRPRAPIR